MNSVSGLSINLFLADRSWSGLVVADASSQNAKILSAPKNKLNDLIAREELKQSGVYVLIGPNSRAEFGLEGYIGESDNLATRLRSHAKTKLFWNRAYVAVSKDGWLSKSHIRFLEARLLQQAKYAPLLTCVTNDKQDLKYDRLSDGETANLEDFMSFLALIMPAIGCPLYAFPDLLSARSASAMVTSNPDFSGGNPRFEIVKGMARGVAYEKDGSFWVCKGSTARAAEYSSLRDGYRKTRRTLESRGILLRDDRQGLLVFTQDVPFNSPSDAAAIIGTTSLNGRKEWKVLGTGMTYAEWEESLKTELGPQSS